MSYLPLKKIGACFSIAREGAGFLAKNYLFDDGLEAWYSDSACRDGCYDLVGSRGFTFTIDHAYGGNWSASVGFTREFNPAKRFVPTLFVPVDVDDKTAKETLHALTPYFVAAGAPVNKRPLYGVVVDDPEHCARGAALATELASVVRATEFRALVTEGAPLPFDVYAPEPFRIVPAGCYFTGYFGKGTKAYAIVIPGGRKGGDLVIRFPGSKVIETSAGSKVPTPYLGVYRTDRFEIFGSRTNFYDGVAAVKDFPGMKDQPRASQDDVSRKISLTAKELLAGLAANYADSLKEEAIAATMSSNRHFAEAADDFMAKIANAPVGFDGKAYDLSPEGDDESEEAMEIGEFAYIS